MRLTLTLALLAGLTACSDGPPPLPEANGPLLVWNTAMWGVAAPPMAHETVPAGTPLTSAGGG